MTSERAQRSSGSLAPRVATSAGALGLVLLLIPGAGLTAQAEVDRDRLAWWRDFGDRRLAALVDEGVAANHDLGAAWARVAQAEALGRQARASLLPTARFDVGVSAAPFDSLGFQLGGLPLGGPGSDDQPEVYYTGSALVNVGLEPDLWGKNLLRLRASRYDVQASEGDRDAQLLALSSRIAETYLDAVAAAARLQVLAQQRQTNEALLELLELRYRRGEASALAVLQQRQQVAATSALEPQARAIARVQRQQLAVLLGRSAAAAPQNLGARLPEEALAGGVPEVEGWLDARPDLRAAHARLRAAEARARSAVRGLLPAVRLSGQGGLQANYFDQLKGQPTWGAGLNLSLPLFEGGRRYAEVEQAEAALRSAREGYQQLRLHAAQELASARVRDQELAQQQRALERQEQAARTAFTEARARYLAGLDSYLDVLSALGVLQQSQLGLVQLQRERLGARVQYFTALGGRAQPARPAAGQGASS